MREVTHHLTESFYINWKWYHWLTYSDILYSYTWSSFAPVAMEATVQNSKKFVWWIVTFTIAIKKMTVSCIVNEEIYVSHDRNESIPYHGVPCTELFDNDNHALSRREEGTVRLAQPQYSSSLLIVSITVFFRILVLDTNTI